MTIGLLSSSRSGKPRDSDRPGKDFSAFGLLVLEMKGLRGGEVIEVALKDNTDPDDGSELKKRTRLDRVWRVYEISLREFKTADLKRLYVVTGFVFDGPDPATVSVRRIEFRR